MRTLASLLIFLTVAACATDPMPEIRAAYDAGDYRFAQEQLRELQDDGGGDAHVYALERALAELAVGDPRAAESALRFARDRLDALQGNNALAWMSSVLLDDRQLDYAGADYEQVMVRALLAIANLIRGGGDADAYALQVLARQTEIMEAYEHEGDHPKARYKLVAFGSYLRGIMNEDDPLRSEVAARSFEKALQLEPRSVLAREGLERSRDGVHSQKGQGVVHVLALVGRGPFRIEVDEPATRDALAIAQIIWSIIRDRVTFPNISSVPVPALAFHQDNPTEVGVSWNGQQVATTEVITDVEATAESEFDAMRAHILARAILRRAVKISATEGAKEIFNPRKRKTDGRREWKEANPVADLLISLGGILWTSAEAADLRCWSLLPASFQAARLELPVGIQEIELRAGRHGRPTGTPQRVRVEVRDGRNTYVLAIMPTPAGGPPPLTSESGASAAGRH